MFLYPSIRRYCNLFFVVYVHHYHAPDRRDAIKYRLSQRPSAVHSVGGMLIGLLIISHPS